jgi:hypothetical protein
VVLVPVPGHQSKRSFDNMKKLTVTKLFLGSLAAVAGGLILGFVGVWADYANGVFVMNGSNVTGIESTPFAWTMIGLAVLGGLAMMGGAIGQFIAWIGALFNTIQLADKAWFIVLLLTGLFSFGFVAMIVYLIAGPDGTAKAAATPLATGRPAPTA